MPIPIITGSPIVEALRPTGWHQPDRHDEPWGDDVSCAGCGTEIGTVTEPGFGVGPLDKQAPYCGDCIQGRPPLSADRSERTPGRGE